ncbi:hypothetical protein ACMD2_10122 [Ananas comosus]|uniref:Lon N-terminal domain-containing protein n=1 Tax=Ananas comosus TaxID=4615 RepID=A0A199UQX0_ANACO|nr:hypothetical protein ACMD2_10122 [Ananas comosus]
MPSTPIKHLPWAPSSSSSVAIPLFHFLFPTLSPHHQNPNHPQSGNTKPNGSPPSTPPLPQPLSPSLPFLNAKSPSPPSGISPRPGPPRRRRLLLRRPCSSASPEPSPSSSSAADDLVELPLFPLPLVLFPGAILPLQIFEFRYRIMMHTLLHTDLRFGVVFSDPGGGAGAGAVAEERFRVSRVVRTKPYLVAAVTWLEDRPPPPDPSAAAPQRTDDLEALAAEVEGYMRDVIRISNRLNGKPEKEEEAASMDLRRNLFPTPFSFFVASTFEGAPREQQALLELEDTAARLRRERDTLRNTLNYLTAASAVKDAFPSSSSSSS